MPARIFKIAARGACQKSAGIFPLLAQKNNSSLFRELSIFYDITNNICDEL